MINLLKFLNLPWERARGYLKEDLDHIEAAINQNWGKAFSTDGTIHADTINGNSTVDTVYVSNTGDSNAPTWSRVDLAKGVQGKLPFTSLSQASRPSIVLGRGSYSPGNLEEINLGPGLMMTGQTLSATAGNSAADGEQGEDGLMIVGPPGPPGKTGPVGPTGQDGDPGEDGAQGLPGVNGATGPQGTSGMGVPGLDGDDGYDGIPGPRGDQGAQGIPGAQGTPGLGVPGLDGDDGYDGWPGPQGSAGSAGTAGATGPQGPAGLGFPGIDGEDGELGFPGPQGTAGAAGATGSVGPQGPAGLGFPGLDGEDGDMGWPGPPGAAGSSSTSSGTDVIRPTNKTVAMMSWAVGVGETGSGMTFGCRGAAVGAAASDTIDNTSTYGLNTSSTTGALRGFTTASNVTRTNQGPVITFRLGTGTSISVVRIWAGLTNAAFAALDNQAIKMVGFRYSTVAGDTGWRGVVDDGTTQTVSANVASIATSTFYSLKIDCSDGTNALFSVDGGATVSLTIPAATKSTDLRISYIITSNENVAKDLKGRGFYLEANT